MTYDYTPTARNSQSSNTPLDFSSAENAVTLKDIHTLFQKDERFSIKKEYESPATLKIEKLQYTGPLVQPNSLKIEIDVFQNVLLPPQWRVYENVWGVAAGVRVMDIQKICAEKIRAMSDRARYRDFYDLFLLLEKYPMNLSRVVGILQQKEIRQPITKARIKENWRIIGTQKNAEMDQMNYARRVSDEQLAALIEQLPFEVISKP